MGTRGGFDDINMTPLIDIVLVVLIIMMVNIPIQIHEMGVKLPSAQPITHAPSTDQLLVAVYQDGQLALNRRAMTEDQLWVELSRQLRTKPSKAVFIDAHPEVPYSRVVDLIDLAHQAKATKIALAKLKPDGPVSLTDVAQGAMPQGVFPGPVAIAGPLSEPVANQTLDRALPLLNACYRQALGANPTLSGRVLARITVAPDGSLMESTLVSSTLGDPPTETCLGRAVAQFRYPAISDNKTAIVQYPLVFSPG